MKRYNIIVNSNGLAGVIEALLLIALVAIIMSTIQLVYVPEIMKQKESDHMDEVLNQFSNLKSIIETQSMMGAIQSGQKIAYSPMSSPITLGVDRLPYFVTTFTSGQLDIIDKNNAGDSEIRLLPACPYFPNGIPLTSIKFTANSNYYVPEEDQKYILEGGCIILNQTNGETIKVAPPIAVENNSVNNTIIIYYTIPIFVCKEGKDITAGIDTNFIMTNYSKKYIHSDILDQANYYIRINSEYLEAWNKTLIHNSQHSSNGILWEYYDNGYISVEYDDPTNPTYIEIKPNTWDIRVEFTIIEIIAQIGPGIII